MYQYQSKFPVLVTRYIDVIALLVMVILSAMHNLIEPGYYSWISVVGAILVVNTIFVFRYIVTYSYCILAFAVVFVFHNIGVLTGYSTLFSLFLDPVMLLSIVVLIVLYWDSADIGQVLAKPLLPLSAFASGLIAIYMNVNYPARYLILTVFDVICSAVISKSPYGHASMFLRALLFFFAIYTSPWLSLGTRTIIAFSVLHILRNTILFTKTPRFLINRVPEITCLDILLKPVLVALT